MGGALPKLRDDRRYSTRPRRRPNRSDQAGDNTLFVTVVGRQWWWEYPYDHYTGKPIRALGPDEKETDLPIITANEPPRAAP
jgi:heme/copper-type cytochrome/quinol oxidase subunit 2